MVHLQPAHGGRRATHQTYRALLRWRRRRRQRWGGRGAWSRWGGRLQAVRGATVRRHAAWPLGQLVRVGGGGAAVVRARAHFHLGLREALVDAVLEAHLAHHWEAAPRGVRRAQPAGELRAAPLVARGLRGHAHARRTRELEPRRLGEGVPIGVTVVDRLGCPDDGVSPGLRELDQISERLRAAGMAQLI